jgi:hypothetical protein
MAYSLHIERSSSGMRITRAPDHVARGLGLAFELAGIAFLVAAPFALIASGPVGMLGSLLASGIALPIGYLVRHAARVVDVQAGTKTIFARWDVRGRTLPRDLQRLRVGPGGRVDSVRVAAFGSADHAGAQWMFAVRVDPEGRSAPVPLVYVDTADEADHAAAQLAEALGVSARAVPEHERAA